jgi:DNA-binding NarL/FixJ family response regulator
LAKVSILRDRSRILEDIAGQAAYPHKKQMDQDRIHLVLLDGHGLFRASLARLLASESGFEIAGECGTAAEALEILCGSSVDVILLDFDLGPEHADGFISAARKAGYQGRFLIVAGAVDAERSAMALKLGASGIFLKSEAPERLTQAIRVIATGAVWIDQKVIQPACRPVLSGRGSETRRGSGRPRTTSAARHSWRPDQ